MPQRRSVFGLLFLLLGWSDAPAQQPMYLYSVHGISNDVWGYSLNSSTGALTKIGTFPAGVVTHGVATSPDNRFLYAFNGIGQSISAYVINPSTGTLTSVPGSPFPAGSGGHSVIVEPKGRFAYGGNSGSISAYTINQTTGALTPVAGSPFPVATSFNMACDPNGRFLYAPNLIGTGVSVLAIDQTTGALVSIPGSPFTSGAFPTEIAIDPLGRFAYVGNGATGTTLDGFRIDPSTGGLSPLPGSPFLSGEARAVTIDPTGRFVFIANERAATVTGFSIDPNTGSLSKISGSPYTVGGTPAAVIVDPTSNFLYVGNSSSNSISAFRINQGTGQLTTLPGSPFQAGQEPLFFAIATPTSVSTLGIQFIQPTRGGNAGSVTMQIVGSGFQAGATVKLTGLGPDIIGTNTSAPTASILNTTFDLTGATPGPRTVVVTNPDNTSVSLPGGFTVEQGGAADLALDILGRDRIRSGQDQTYYLVAINRGLNDGLVLFDEGVSTANGTTSALQISPSPCTFGAPLVDVINSGFSTIYPGVCHLTSGCSNVTYKAHDSSNQSGCSTELLNFKSAKAGLQFIQQKLDDARTQKTLKELLYLVLGCALRPNDQDCKDLQDEINNLATLIPILGRRLADAQAAYDVALQALVNCLRRPLPSSGQFSSALTAAPATSPVEISGSITLCAVSSLDPNDKIGANGSGLTRFVGAALPIDYSIYFDNQSTATAPAQTVTITDRLDINLDLNTLILGPITFPSQVVTPPSIPLSIAPFATTVDFRPTKSLLVKTTASLNTSTGVLTWTLQSLDPATGLPPADPFAGFLPPGAEGSVFFTVVPKSKVTTGAVVQNTATVVFDVNPPINTPTWSNTIDNTKPTSHVNPLAATQTTASFPVQWSGTDIGSGVQDFTIYVSDNGSPFSTWLTHTASTQATYSGVAGHTYGFYSIARDLVGNVESSKTTAEATTTVQQVTSLTITNYQIVGQQAAAGGKSAVTYRADLLNPGPPLGSVTATLTTPDPSTVRVSPGQDTLTFSPVPANGQVTSKNTFTVIVDTGIPLDTSKLQWTFQSTPAPPVANAGSNQTVTVGSTVTLDGTGSTNPSGIGALTYNWVFTSRPPGSTTRLLFTSTPTATFVPDAVGAYVITLTVSNGVASNSTTVTITAR